MSLFGRKRFHRGQMVMSVVYHPPVVQPGTMATIVSHRAGQLAVVMLPTGEIHQWFADFELSPINHHSLHEGDFATVISALGHHHIMEGTVVRIVKLVETPYYDVMLHGTEYHRWLAEFEIACPLSYSVIRE